MASQVRVFGDGEGEFNGAWAPTDDASSDPLADAEERRVLLATLDSFRQYRRQSHYNTTHRRRQNLYALPPPHRAILTAPPFSLLDHLSAVDDAIDSNADIADAIFARGLASFNIDPDHDNNNTWLNSATPDQHAKAHSTIRQLYRDWTAVGFATEVKPVLDLILASLRRHGIQPSTSTSTSTPHILVPGAGLGRILLELCLAGYNATGNEISYHQLLAGDEYESAFDAVTTVYFIDTAPNLLRYIETIHGNDGNDDENNAATTDQGIGQPGAFELADDQVRQLVRSMGFVIHPDEEYLLPESESGAGLYMQDPDSMLQNRYRPSFWVATKIEENRTDG
ncbi:hypothetical protein DV735_g4340, partial [Chaetothyriales sp. CBS 134920]